MIQSEETNCKYIWKIKEIEAMKLQISSSD